MAVQQSRDDAKASGLKRYFLNLACKHGHVDQRYTSDGQCCECMRVKLKKRYAKNPEHWKSVSRNRQLNLTVEQKAEYARRIREKRKQNPEIFAEYEDRKRAKIKSDPVLAEKERLRQLNKQKRAYAKHPEKYKKKASDRHDANRDRNNELAKQWKSENPEKVKALNDKWGPFSRAERKKRIPPWLTAEDKEKIRKIYAEAKSKGLQVDHIIPLQGKTVSGLHVPSNLQLLTRSENASKRNSFKAGS